MSSGAVGAGLDDLAEAAAGLSRRQVVRLAAAIVLTSAIPRWSGSARAAEGVWAHPAKTTGTCPPQARGICQETRSVWTPSCGAPIAKGKSSSFNGCGPQGGIDLPVVGKGDWIPDKPLALADFFEACKAHDCCYGRCGSVKSDCDGAFLERMAASCRAAWPDDSTSDDIGYGYCLGMAFIYYKAVSATETGSNAYNAGQAEVCDCCTCGGAECKPTEFCCNGACCRSGAGDPTDPGEACCESGCTQLGTTDNCSDCGDVCTCPGGGTPVCYAGSCNCF